MKNRIDTAFERCGAAKRAAFMPFLTAGDPTLAATAALIEECERRGADLLELGIPYSDPVADGPTSQASYGRALGAGCRLEDIFDMLRGVRERCKLPILTMVSFSIVSRHGPQAYFGRAAEAGVDGVIIPDLPIEEGTKVARLAEKARLHPVFLVAPTTPDERMKGIVRRSRGFIYYIAVTGTTGARAALPADLAQHIARVKAATDKPVAVGFGVSSPDQVAAVAQVADGVIVGSAIVRKVAECAGRPLPQLVEEVGRFVAELAAATKKTA